MSPAPTVPRGRLSRILLLGFLVVTLQAVCFVGTFHATWIGIVGILPGEDPGPAPPRAKRVSLLTSYPARFAHKMPPKTHWTQVQAAIRANLVNPFLDQVVVVLDSASPAANCSHFVPTILDFPFEQLSFAPRKLRKNAPTPAQRFACINRKGGQPNYYEMFEYTLLREVQGEIVIMSNTDQAFDETVDVARYVKPGVMLVVGTQGFQPLIPDYVKEIYERSTGMEAPLVKDPTGKVESLVENRCLKRREAWGLISWDAWIFNKNDLLLEPQRPDHHQPFHDNDREPYPTDPVPLPSILDPLSFLRRKYFPKSNDSKITWIDPVPRPAVAPPMDSSGTQPQADDDADEVVTIRWDYFRMNEMGAEIAAAETLRNLTLPPSSVRGNDNGASSITNATSQAVFHSLRNVCHRVKLWHFHSGNKSHRSGYDELDPKWLQTFTPYLFKDQFIWNNDDPSTRFFMVRNTSIANNHGEPHQQRNGFVETLRAIANQAGKFAEVLRSSEFVPCKFRPLPDCKDARNCRGLFSVKY